VATHFCSYCSRSRISDVYLQMALPDPDLLKGYEGVELSG
jgi:hypothetical protein